MSIFSAVANAVKSIRQGAPAPQNVLSPEAQWRSYKHEDTPAVQRMTAQDVVNTAKAPKRAFPNTYQAPNSLDIIKGVGTLAKDVAQGTARSVGSVGASISELLPGGSDEVKTPTIPIFKQVSKALFGEEPIPTLSKRAAESEQVIKTIGEEKNLPNLSKAALPLAIAGTLGSTALDFTPFGGEEKTVARLAESRSPKVIKAVLKGIRIPTEEVEKLAPLFVQARTASEVRAALRYAKSTSKEAKVVSKELAPVTKELEPYKLEGNLKPKEYLFKDNFGGSVSGEIKDGTAYIYDAFSKERGHRLLESSINDLSKRGVSKIEVNLQSANTQAVLNNLVERGLLKNARGGDIRVKGGGAKTIFDISAAPDITKESVPFEYPQKVGQLEPKPFKTKYKGTDLSGMIKDVTESLQPNRVKRVGYEPGATGLRSAKGRQEFTDSIAAKNELVQKLTKESSEDGVVKLLTDAGYPRNIARYYREELANAKSTLDIKNELSQMESQIQADKEFNLKHGIEDEDAGFFNDQTSRTVPTSRTPLERPERERYRKMPGLPPGTTLPHLELPSFDSIISPIARNVKEKVHIFDYLKTPEQVLEKVGLGRESKMLRAADESYNKQLDQSFKFLQELRATVPGDEASDLIARYLDGQKLPRTMSPDELKVGHILKNYYADLANKLKIPKEGRISEYFPHIFEKGDIEMEFDPALAKLIEDKVPGSVYDPFLQRRLGKKGYLFDVWKATDAYTKRAVRKFNFDPVLETIAKKSGSLDVDTEKYIKRYLWDVNMRPKEIDNLLDNFIKSTPIGYKLGQRPTMTLLGKFRKLVYLGSLGGNVGSAIRNLTQGVNTYAELGERYTLKGYTDLFRNGTQEVKDAGLLNNHLITDRKAVSTKMFDIHDIREAGEKTLFALFDTVENINRASAYYGAKAKALDAGFDIKEAIDYAKKVVRKTQFQFGRIDTPVAIGGDIMKTAAQFQSFNLKQGEFLINKIKDKDIVGLVRWLGGSLTILYTMGQLFGMQWTDLIPTLRLGGSPAGNILSGLSSQISTNPQKRAEGKQKIQNALVQLVPGGVQAKKTIQGIQAAEKQTGNKVLNYIRGATFGKYTFAKPKPDPGHVERVKAETEQQKARAKLRDEVQKTYDYVQKLKETDTEAAKAIVDALSDDEYEAYKQIRANEKAKATNQLKDKMYTVYQQVQSLKDSGKIQEAQAIVDALQDDEYTQYQKIKELMTK